MIRNRYILLLDLLLIATAAFGAFALRFDWLFYQYRPEFSIYLIAALLIKPLVYYPFGMYTTLWRYATARDLVGVALAVSASAVVMAVFVGLGRVMGEFPGFSRPVLLIDWLLSLALAGGLRMSARIVGDAQRTRQKPRGSTTRRVMVIGAGDAGNLVVCELRKNPQLGLSPVVFLDDSIAKRNRQIQGIPVRGPLSSLETVVRAEAIDDVVIAMPTAPGTAIRRATDACGRVNIAPRVVPGVFELLDGQVTVNRLRRVEIADLLRRPQAVGQTARASYLVGRSVLITGAGGSIGSELARQVAYSRPARLILLGHGENSIFGVHAKLVEQYPGLEIHPVIADVRNASRLDNLFDRFRPAIVFHAAAHKHVPLMELNPEEAVTNNVRGTANILRAAVRSGIERLVMVSTDKAVAPSSIMGASKRLAERLVLQAGRRHHRGFVVVRFGNVLGSRGSVVPTLQGQIERGGPVTITHPDMKRFFMTIPEAVQLVLQAGGMGTGGDLFVLNMGEQLKVLDLARDLIQLSGLDPASVPIEFTGVRPGEKLEEVLWEPGASLEATAIPDILRVRESGPRHELDVMPFVDDVVAAAESEDTERLLMTLAVALPDFVVTSRQQGLGCTPRKLGAE